MGDTIYGGNENHQALLSMGVGLMAPVPGKSPNGNGNTDDGNENPSVIPGTKFKSDARIRVSACPGNREPLDPLRMHFRREVRQDEEQVLR
ncbi:MAG: hypothetical protein LBR80_11600 [Deltaproteobacteria bacterium]|nr:hypothetical protein [Deltaproteobacteria bacterium]